MQYLIESLNDDGYLEESLEALALGLAGERDLEQIEELVHRFTVALHLLQSLEPTGWGTRSGGMPGLQLQAMLQEGAADRATVQTAQCVCQQPLELLARRDVRRLVALCGASEERTRAAIALIARLRAAPWATFCRCGAQCRGA